MPNEEKEKEKTVDIDTSGPDAEVCTYSGRVTSRCSN